MKTTKCDLLKTENQKIGDVLEHNVGSFLLIATVNFFICYFFPRKSKEYENHFFWANSFTFSFLSSYLVGIFFCFIHCAYANDKFKAINIASQLVLNILSILIVYLLTYHYFSKEERHKREEDKKKLLNKSRWKRELYRFGLRVLNRFGYCVLDGLCHYVLHHSCKFWIRLGSKLTFLLNQNRIESVAALFFRVFLIF